ncbi:uncharacterized protein LOC124619602 [Schistocerca americana]|uniref:uncharacterized protein LOC124619602 n=1 Tax=Schistocerca americana TaxID=7009 RepID=UPI001F4F6FC0|nr:uncharacterized protein LOC124619602 [Schistocerca americana]XP_049939756.1 uncharacterized protein LOC126416207 [Schistocerca serialis cubense]
MRGNMLWCLLFLVGAVTGRLSPLDEFMKTRFATTAAPEAHRSTTEEPPAHNYWDKQDSSYEDDYYNVGDEDTVASPRSQEAADSSEESDDYDEDKYNEDKYHEEDSDEEEDEEEEEGKGYGPQQLGSRRRHGGHGQRGHASHHDPMDDYLVEDVRAGGDAGDDFDDDDDEEDGDVSSESDESLQEEDAAKDADEKHLEDDSREHVQNDDNSARGGGYPTSSYSEHKWNTLGSRKAIETYRKSRPDSRINITFRNKENEVRLAVENALRVNREHECRWPVPRLVRVKDVFPQPNKRYIPHCASLHQCADDTGCCHSDTLACVPAKTHPVSLYFYSTTLGSGAGYVVEKLTFYNHTECRCEDKLDAQMPRDMALPLHTSRLQPPENRRSVLGSCRCPSHFAARRLSAGAVCLCECFGAHHYCLRQRRGKEYFSQADKHCIQSGECALPGCEYGQYLRKAGRCPRKRERLSAWNAMHHRLYNH